MGILCALTPPTVPTEHHRLYIYICLSILSQFDRSRVYAVSAVKSQEVREKTSSPIRIFLGCMQIYDNDPFCAAFLCAVVLVCTLSAIRTDCRWHVGHIFHRWERALAPLPVFNRQKWQLLTSPVCDRPRLMTRCILDVSLCPASCRKQTPEHCRSGVKHQQPLKDVALAAFSIRSYCSLLSLINLCLLMCLLHIHAVPCQK